MSSADSQLVGRWRIVEADLWDRDYLDLSGPATLTIGPNGDGEIAFGALEASLEIGSGRSIVFFNWDGADDMTPVTGEGSAELMDNGSLEITFSYHNGDEATLKAKRMPSSTPC